MNMFKFIAIYYSNNKNWTQLSGSISIAEQNLKILSTSFERWSWFVFSAKLDASDPKNEGPPILNTCLKRDTALIVRPYFLLEASLLWQRLLVSCSYPEATDDKQSKIQTAHKTAKKMFR